MQTPRPDLSGTEIFWRPLWSLCLWLSGYVLHRDVLQLLTSLRTVTFKHTTFTVILWFHTILAMILSESQGLRQDLVISTQQRGWSAGLKGSRLLSKLTVRTGPTETRRSALCYDVRIWGGLPVCSLIRTARNSISRFKLDSASTSERPE